MVGESVGNYRITSLLGEGGMGAVYVAEHPGIGRRVAVKVLLPELAKNQEMITRFFNEARAANAIRHPGIVEVLDFGTLASGASYIVMELLEGESLAALLSRVGRLSPEAAVEIAVQAAGALGAAHAKEIIHRDLKPDNLYVVPDPQNPGRERIKVLDFGIAKLASGLQAGASSVKTRTGAIMGTPIYMSPEQCRGTRVIDHRSDLYALGVILFEMVCGTPPFLSDGQGELVYMHIAEAPTSPRQLNPEVSPSLDAAILRLLAKDPAQRFQTMDELAQTLRAHPARDTGASRNSPTAQALVAQPAPGMPMPRTLATPVVLSTPGRTLVLPGDAPATPRQRPPSSGRPVMTTLGSSAVAPPEAIPRRGRRAMPIVLGLLVVATAGTAFVVVQRPRGSSSLPAEAPLAAASPPPVGAATRPVPAAPASGRPTPSVQSVSVSVRSKPAGAQLIRESDGAVLGVTPFNGSAPAHVGVERVKAVLPGYAEERIVLPLDEDVDLSLALKPVPSGAAASSKRRPHAQHTHPAPHPTAGTTAPEPTAEPVPL